MKVHRMDSHGGWIATPIDLLRFLVRVDGFNKKPPLLSAATIKTMFTPPSVHPSYAKGWSITGQNYWHNGSLPGENSVMVRAGTGLEWAVVVNTRSQKTAFGNDLDQLMWNVTGKVTTWPAGLDLF